MRGREPRWRLSYKPLSYNPLDMTSNTRSVLITCVISLTAIVVSNRLGVLQGQEKKTPGVGFAAVPGQKGGQDTFGPYDPVQNWEKPLTDGLPDRSEEHTSELQSH